MKYDAIVIGSGSAGSIIATRLSEQKDKSILLIEAGPDYENIEKLPNEIKYGYATGNDQNQPNQDHDWKYVGRATKYTPEMSVPRGKVTGGSSSINGQIFFRGIPEDYDEWVSQGNEEWSYEKLLPYFRKLETDLDFQDDFHGTKGPIMVRRNFRENLSPQSDAFYQACLDNNYGESKDLNHPDSTGVSPTPINNIKGIRWSTAIGYLDLSRHRLNLNIKSNCFVKKILFNKEKAVGVQVESKGEIFEVYGEKIILSAGAIGSPHLLLLSGLGPKSQLQKHNIPIIKDLPGVGKNLNDHPIVWITYKTKKSFKLNPFTYNMQVLCRYTGKKSKFRNDMLLVMCNYTQHNHDNKYKYPAHPKNFYSQLGKGRKSLGIRIIVGLWLAESRGELSLISSNPKTHPSLNFNYLDTEFDKMRMREGIHKAIELGEHPSFKNIIEKRIEPTDKNLESELSLNKWLMQNSMTGQHISGTCKMGPSSDNMSVVNQYGKVHSVENLFLADSSIMPHCIRANTNVTTMMIGERMSDFFKEII
ncbi:MAG: GMC family oxidoreductase N-terminal domain-containing protein [SAR202 cluster bacterium]|jgi:choline dehydrogenase|nr:GMC family oxidoreductase N-terminal domain-containing protein [SAR202 cluster bacterium]